MRLKRRRKVRKLVAGSLAFIACLAMGMTMFFSQSNAVYASENTADPSTAMNYQETYNQGSTQYAGRIWTDKSVGTTAEYGNNDFKLGKGEDFLVTFSALSSAQTIKSQTASPIDVVFVLDFSASMTWGVDSQELAGDKDSSRIKYLVDSLNNTIDTLVNANENNRIGIVTFNTIGRTFMDLTTAKDIKDKNIQNKNYLELDTFEGERTTYVTNHINGARQNTYSKTNIQYGLNEAMQMLMSEDETTVLISGENGKEQIVQRIPNVVLMSDGAPTTIFSDQGPKAWWEDLNNSQNESIGWGDNSKAWSANGLLPMMTASYMKNVVTEHYFGTNTNNDQMNIYTIGFSTNQQTDEMVELANLVLNPVDNLDKASDSGTDEIRLLAEAWEDYLGEGNPNVHYVTESSRESHDYRLTHPNSNDINTLKYNTEYYPATNSSELDQAFESITNSMVDQGKAPTEVTEGLTNSGYITYTDTIGDYMELKDVKGLVVDNKFFTGVYNRDKNTITFDGKFVNNVYGEQDLRNLQITISEKNGRQVLTMKIPASLIPIVHDIVELDASDSVTGQKEEKMYPMRLVYSVGLKEDILQSDGNINYSVVSNDYIQNHMDGEGNVLFFSNYYDGTNSSLTSKTAGNAFVEYEPAHDNSYYFIQKDTPIYLDNMGTKQATSIDPDTTYYVPFTYYENQQKVTTYEARLGSIMSGYTKSIENYAYLEAGAPRLGNIADFTKDKSPNETNTAATSYAPTFQYRTEGDAQSGTFRVYLGNNGELKVPTASLTIQKNVTADEGLTAPDATFTFEITSQAKKSTTVKAYVTEESKEPVSMDVKFDEDGKARVTLQESQSIEFMGMEKADYQIQEINIPDGFTLKDVSGADNLTDENIASGTVGAGETVVFTNNYSVDPVTSTDLKLPLSGTKTMEGRDFQDGDNFTFTIAAAQATPDAPLPKDENGKDVTSVTINPESENATKFKFDGVIR